MVVRPRQQAQHDAVAAFAELDCVGYRHLGVAFLTALRRCRVDAGPGNGLRINIAGGRFLNLVQILGERLKLDLHLRGRLRNCGLYCRRDCSDKRLIEASLTSARAARYVCC